MNSTSHQSYDIAKLGFDLAEQKALLNGDFVTGLNACVECCDRYSGSNRVALRCVSAAGEVETYTFEQLQDLSARIAQMLVERGVVAGDVVAGMLPRVPMLVATILGVWRLGGVYQPLFTAFGSQAIEQRLATSQAKMVITDPTNRAKLVGMENCPTVATLLGPNDVLFENDIDLNASIAMQSGTFAPVMLKGSDLFLMMSTSGTTGAPKGVSVDLSALLSFGVYMRDGIDLREDDVFWNIADPGWAYGLYYAVIGPLLLGRAMTFSEGAFSAENLYDIVERLGVTNLAGSPTAFRLLISDGAKAVNRLKGQLRVISSAGEPLNPEVIRWFSENLNVPINDHYGQTELGMVVNNHHGLKHSIRLGSAGFAMPGFRVAVLDEAGTELGPNQPGELAVDVNASPLMWFKGYYKESEPAIVNGYYRSGDNVELEPDGSVSFIGRSDDVITSSGYKIGPFDVESALFEHPSVVESAVVGVPDPQRTEIVMAFVILAAGVEGTDALAEELRLHVKNLLSAHAYPRKFSFVSELPKTPSGKIQRFVLRNAETARLSSGVIS